MSVARVAFAVLSLAAVRTSSRDRHANDVLLYAVADDDGNVSIQPEENGRFVGKAVYTRRTNGTGWDYLEIFTSFREDDSLQAYAAGLLEGFVTADSIDTYWGNVADGFCDGRTVLCAKLYGYLRTNAQWVASQVAGKNGSDAYWHQVGLVYRQLDGLYDGYKANAVHGTRPLTREHFLWMNVQEDLYDLCDAFNSSHPRKKPFGTGSCSVLIKLLPGYKELLSRGTGVDILHDNNIQQYETMLRIQKRYRLNYKESRSTRQMVLGHDMTFTSYPGFLYSLDDFYLISSGLAVTETTNSVYNPQLWANIQPVGQILTFVRAMVANRLASDGLAWTKLFKRHNSGTCNNQWMVINYSLFRPGRNETSKHGLLYVLEQMPGLVVARDVTALFLEQTYWASYNVPFFPAVFAASGQQDMVERYGNWFSYRDTPRARIFARDHDGVTGVRSMLRLMRSNDFRNDPESRCESCVPPYSAENAISSRDDLNDRDGVYPFEALGYSNWGGVDAKVTSHRLFKERKFLAVSGPTSGDGGRLGTFCWSKSRANNFSHAGLPDCWDFKPEIHQWVF